MIRTASDGHETLRALLTHTADPLPLVLALDDMDPDDPLTQRIAADLAHGTEGVVIKHYIKETDRNLTPHAPNTTQEAATLKRYGISIQETKNLFHSVYQKRPTDPTTPATALARIQLALDMASKFGIHPSIPKTANQIAILLDDTDAYHLHVHDYQGARYIDTTLRTHNKNRPVLESLTAQLEPTYSSRVQRQYDQTSKELTAGFRCRRCKTRDLIKALTALLHKIQPSARLTTDRPPGTRP